MITNSKLIAGIVFIVVLSSNTNAAQLFIYTSPTGERVVTDRPIYLDGYELEQNKLNAQTAGLSLRYQDTTKNRDLIDKYIRNAAYLYDMESELI